MDPYALIAQYPNAGEAFSNSFNKGMEQNALSAFAMNPNDPKAQGAAARYDPRAVAQVRTQQQELSAQHQKDWHEYAGNLAKWANSPQRWDQAVDQMVAQGFPEAAQLKGRYSPELRANFMALGGVKDDNDPGIINEYNTAKEQHLIGPDVTFEAYLGLRNPGGQTPIVLPQNYSVVGGGQGGAPGGGMPTVSSPQEAAKLPPGTQFRMPDGRIGTVPGQGGQAATPSATFP